jgi:hypothetical protein
MTTITPNIGQKKERRSALSRVALQLPMRDSVALAHRKTEITFGSTFVLHSPSKRCNTIITQSTNEGVTQLLLKYHLPIIV